jgi:hypothetical protein
MCPGQLTRRWCGETDLRRGGLLAPGGGVGRVMRASSPNEPCPGTQTPGLPPWSPCNLDAMHTRSLESAFSLSYVIVDEVTGGPSTSHRVTPTETLFFFSLNSVLSCLFLLPLPLSNACLPYAYSSLPFHPNLTTS